MSNLATSYTLTNRIEEGEKIEEEVLEIKTRVRGKDHPSTLLAVHCLADTYRQRGKLGEAVELGERALEGKVRVLGKTHPETLHAMALLAMIYFQMERIGDGVRIQEDLRQLEDGDGGKYSKRVTDFLRRSGFV
jgi:hypothetical protein